MSRVSVILAFESINSKSNVAKHEGEGNGRSDEAVGITILQIFPPSPITFERDQRSKSILIVAIRSRRVSFVTKTPRRVCSRHSLLKFVHVGVSRARIRQHTSYVIYYHVNTWCAYGGEPGLTTTSSSKRGIALFRADRNPVNERNRGRWALYSSSCAVRCNTCDSHKCGVNCRAILSVKSVLQVTSKCRDVSDKKCTG